MKPVGIVRRVDDLGRVVIPKEIRRSLHIEEGDPLELWLDSDMVCFKKYSPVANLENIGQEYADSLFEVTGLIVLITDRHGVIAMSGMAKRDFLNRVIGGPITECIESKSTRIVDEPRDLEEMLGNNILKNAVIAPIVAEGDGVGSVIICSAHKESIMRDAEQKLAEVAAEFLAKQISMK